MICFALLLMGLSSSYYLDHKFNGLILVDSSYFFCHFKKIIHQH